MANEQTRQSNDAKQAKKAVEISNDMINDLVTEIIELEKDHLYVNRANLKEKIVTLIKTKVR